MLPRSLAPIALPCYRQYVYHGQVIVYRASNYLTWGNSRDYTGTVNYISWKYLTFLQNYESGGLQQIVMTWIS